MSQQRGMFHSCREYLCAATITISKLVSMSNGGYFHHHLSVPFSTRPLYAIENAKPTSTKSEWLVLVLLCGLMGGRVKPRVVSYNPPPSVSSSSHRTA